MSRIRTDNAEDLAAARKYAFLLLKFRLRSETELRMRLLKKGFSPGASDKTLEWLKEKKFVDDEAFARLWAASRLKRPYGKARITQELRRKGVSAKVLSQALADASQEYDEASVVKELALSRMRMYKGIDQKKACQRLYAFLIRRGFSPDIIMEAIESL